MAGRLAEDPNRAKTPDYTTEAFAPLRVALTTGDRTKEEAIQLLTATWRDDIYQKKRRWARRLEEDRLADAARIGRLQEERQEPKQQGGGQGRGCES